MPSHSLVITILFLSTANLIHAAEPTFIHYDPTHGNLYVPTTFIPCAEYNYSIRDAIKNGDKEEVVRLICKNRILLNQPDERGYTPLHLAVMFDKPFIVHDLLELFSDIQVNQQDKHGWTPAHWAALESRNCLASLLANPKIKTDKPDLNGKIPLHFATQAGNISSVSQLLEHSDNHAINQQDLDGNTPLHVATNHHIIALLLLHGANRHIKNKNGISPAVYAIVQKVLESFRQLR